VDPLIQVKNGCYCGVNFPAEVVVIESLPSLSSNIGSSGQSILNDHGETSERNGQANDRMELTDEQNRHFCNGHNGSSPPPETLINENLTGAVQSMQKSGKYIFVITQRILSEKLKILLIRSL
jgi:hypothetical protein